MVKVVIKDVHTPFGSVFTSLLNEILINLYFNTLII